MNPPQVVPEILAGPRIERAQRLVKNQELGLRHKRPRQGRSQPLKRRQLLGTPAGKAVDPQRRQRFRDSPPPIGSRAFSES